MTFTITRPDSSTLNLTRSTNSAIAANGLLTQTEIKNSLGASQLRVVNNYANDPSGSPQVQAVTIYDDTGTPRKSDFDYDQYGNITNAREYGFQQSGSFVVRRRTHNVFKTDTSYVNAFLRNLVVEQDLYDAQLDTNDANDVLIAKTTYTYDDYNAMGGMENYGGTASPPGHLSSYDTTRTVRGNPTGTTEFTDVVANTSITRLAKYDIFGNLTKAQVACCNQKSFTFDQSTYWSNPVQVINGDPAGLHLTNAIAYDFNTSLVTSTTDPNNLSASYSYDGLWRPTQLSYPTGATQTRTYSDGNMSMSRSLNYVDNGTNKTVTGSQGYDAWRNTTQTIDQGNGQVNFAYDTMGRVQSITNPFAAGGQPAPATTYAYDALGRRKTETRADNSTIQTSYSGSTITLTDEVGRKIQRQGDGLGRLVTVTEEDSSGALTQTTNYTYDLLDDLTQVNQGNQLRSFKYDALRRRLFERIPEQSATINDGTGTFWSAKYTYTDFHALATKQDARGVVITNSYDALNRLQTVSYNTSGAPGVATTPNVTYNYDNSGAGTTKGLLLSVNDGTFYTESYAYDSVNRPQSVTHTIDGHGYTTSYQYNTASQRTQTTYPSTRAITVGHDSSGRMNGLTLGGNGGNYLSAVNYTPAEQVSDWQLGNGVKETFGYDANRLQLTTQQAKTASSDVANVANLTYSYTAQAGQLGVGTSAGNAGQLMSISGNLASKTESATYTYDVLGRLTTSNQTSNLASAQRRFVYDRWGNRTAVFDATSGGNQIQTVTLQQSGGAPTNRISTVNSTTYTYDAAGNVTNDGIHSYTYDAENRLVSIDGGAASYAYDQRNWRVKKTVGTAVTHYVWENGQVIAEHDGSSGIVQSDYVFAGNRLIAKDSNLSRQYFISDRLNVRLTMDANANVTGRQAHLPFGEDFAETGAQEKHHFTSYERDPESSLDYAVNRQYASAVGRFAQADPYEASNALTDPRSWNRYSYTRNVLTNRVDPTGLQDEGANIAPCQYAPNGILQCPDVGGTVNISGGEGGIFGGLGGGFGIGDHPPRPPLVDAQGGGAGGIAEPPAPPDEVSRQQRRYNRCARNAIGPFRRAELRAGYKVFSGTFASGVTAVLAAEAGAAYIGTRAALRAIGATILRYNPLYQTLLGTVAGSPVTTLGTLALVQQGFEESVRNNEALNQALADCAARFPDANHDTFQIFLTTPF